MRLEGGGLRQRSYEAMIAFLRNHKKQKVLVAAAPDTSALGALQAVRETEFEKTMAIVGQDYIPEVLDEMRSGAGGLIGSVSHEVQTYGPRADPSWGLPYSEEAQCRHTTS